MGCLPFILISWSLFLHYIESIEIQGNHALGEDVIAASLGFTPPCPLTESEITSGINNTLKLYLENGFSDTQISYHIQDATMVLFINEGMPCRIASIHISGNRFIKDEIVLRTLDLKKGSLFSKRAFEHGIAQLLIFYGNRGFPFINIIPLSFAAQEGSLAIRIEVEEGPRLRWGETLVQGNTVTHPSVIRKQMSIPRGEYFSERQLQTARAWLAQLRFLEEGSEPALLRGEKSNTVDVLITIRETKSNTITGIMGYLPPTDGQEGGVVGYIHTELLNLFGTARALSVSWEKHTAPSTELHVSYTEPWLLGTRAGGMLSFWHLLEDTLYSTSGISAEVTADISPSLSLGFVANGERFSPATIALPPSRKYSAGLRFIIETLDYPYNPRKGIHYAFYTEYGKKGSEDIMEFDFEMLNVLSHFNNQAAVLLMVAQALRTSDPPLPEYELFPLGGYRSLRGYRERQFKATKILRASGEYRFIVSRTSRLYLFYDAAFFETASYPDNVKTEYFRDGFGAGAAFPAGIGILSIEYALGEERAFLKGKIHLGLDATF